MNAEAPGGLATTFARLIAATGPVPIAHYMAEANARYYGSRDPLGTGGDFVTAPEISQMFGELIGLWLADIWQRAGRPADVCYVELGPGRGTLAQDALRAARQAGLTPEVHFVETSAALGALQRAAHPRAFWHDDLTGLPTDRPLLIVANEFLDALPVRQLVRTANGWRERMVGLDAEGAFIPVAGTRPMDAAVPEAFAGAGEGAIVETSPASATVLQEVGHRLASQGGAALFIDYGYTEPQLGSTLQAVRAHRKVDVFAEPGEADLTAHVDFATLARVAEEAGARWLGTSTQGVWLAALGIGARAGALARSAPHAAEPIEAATMRLTAPTQMGTLFKVMGLSAPRWPDGAGFARVSTDLLAPGPVTSSQDPSCK
ncbi:ATP synthase subunit beta [Novosphingobium fuchskuhlense]|uniref:ATP synthase subunit beta n=1 Tax=Novosphingobium fuchskuhlense TaxID=1117702 RepID=A0A117UZB9_9SPHN|nr:SAM-dependent methyltransferase [Novosphingobium fuchskuhlense]KUR73626.1 ATP synthase subunit beta [Novosphingobium fuchskuhlense]